MDMKMPGPTRRRFAGGLAFALGGFAVPGVLDMDATGQSMQQLPPTNPDDVRTALHQEVELPASAARVESALLDEKQFAAFSGLPASIDGREGGAFSMFSGMIVGRTVEIVSGERVVQAWRPTHWDAGVYSLVKFEFRPSGNATLVVLDHTGFPAGQFDHLSAGWYAHYWEPLKKFLA